MHSFHCYFLRPGDAKRPIVYSMWFHRPFRADDWLLYDVDSPSSAAARALVRGRLFSRDGSLVASTAQEGLIRLQTQAKRPVHG